MGHVILPNQRNATRIGDTDYYRVAQYINELFYTVKIVHFKG